MTWTESDKLQYLLRLPWTIVPDRDASGLVLRVKELPAALAAGSDIDDLGSSFWESLTETLRAYLHFGDPIPLPPGVRSLPWNAPSQPPLIRSQGVYQVVLSQDRLKQLSSSTAGPTALSS